MAESVELWAEFWEDCSLELSNVGLDLTISILKLMRGILNLFYFRRYSIVTR